MGDPGSKKDSIGRKANKTSKVNRIVSLLEISRPNKHQNKPLLQRTNSMPAARSEIPDAPPPDGANKHARFERIKEEIESKTTEEKKGENRELRELELELEQLMQRGDSEFELACDAAPPGDPNLDQFEGESETDWGNVRKQLFHRFVGNNAAKNSSESLREHPDENRRFIKNREARRSKRTDTRRTSGDGLETKSVKEMASRFEGFIDAERKGAIESYRRDVVRQMDQEIENMKLDGFNATLGDDRFEDNEAFPPPGSSDDNYSTRDDVFGEMLFGEDLERGLFFVECHNADGKELEIVSIQVDRKSVDLDKLDEVKAKSELLVQHRSDERTLILMIDSDEGSNNDSKRTTMCSTTSGDSFDDDDDDEGIDIERPSSGAYSYGSARRETYCDDEGVVRIERVVPYGDDGGGKSTHVRSPPTDFCCGRSGENCCAPEVKKETLQYIIEEIKATERKYIEDMEKVIYEYRPFLNQKYPEKTGAIFGNIRDIYVHQLAFKDTLEGCDDDVNKVVQVFIDFDSLFRLYPKYFRNSPRANAAAKELASAIKEKQEQLNDKLHLSAYLLTPLQRLAKYKLFLEHIARQLAKDARPAGAAQTALDIVKKYLSRGNDAVAVASISDGRLRSKDYGAFIAREKFAMVKPKRMELTVFLFEGVVVFTTEDQRNVEQFVYWQSIKTNDLRIATFEDTTLHLTDYTRSKRRNFGKYTYILDAKSQKVKEAWRRDIEDILWKQLKKAKENTLKEYESGKKVGKKFGRTRAKSTGPTNCNKIDLPQDAFAFSKNSIRCCPFDITGYGLFILMDEFKVHRPKKMTLVVFLFEKIIIFTKKQPNEETFYYIGSIKMDQLSMLPINHKNKTVLELKDYVNSAKFHKDITFKLEAPSEYVQKQWRTAIERCLWNQLLKARERSLKAI